MASWSSKGNITACHVIAISVSRFKRLPPPNNPCCFPLVCPPSGLAGYGQKSERAKLRRRGRWTEWCTARVNDLTTEDIHKRRVTWSTKAPSSTFPLHPHQRSLQCSASLSARSTTAPIFLGARESPTTAPTMAATQAVSVAESVPVDPSTDTIAERCHPMDWMPSICQYCGSHIPLY